MEMSLEAEDAEDAEMAADAFHAYEAYLTFESSVDCDGKDKQPIVRQLGWTIAALACVI
jgi:hypothetical protein